MTKSVPLFANLIGRAIVLRKEKILHTLTYFGIPCSAVAYGIFSIAWFRLSKHDNDFFLMYILTLITGCSAVGFSAVARSGIRNALVQVSDPERIQFFSRLRHSMLIPLFLGIPVAIMGLYFFCQWIECILQSV